MGWNDRQKLLTRESGAFGLPSWRTTTGDNMVPDPNETEISDTNSDQTAVAQSEPTNADVNETDAASAAETEEDGGTVV